MPETRRAVRRVHCQTRAARRGRAADHRARRGRPPGAGQPGVHGLPARRRPVPVLRVRALRRPLGVRGPPLRALRGRLQRRPRRPHRRGRLAAVVPPAHGARDRSTDLVPSLPPTKEDSMRHHPTRTTRAAAGARRRRDAAAPAPPLRLTATTATTAVEEVDPAGQQYRPLLHFSPEKNWMNDPNGMVLHEGTYHLFFQHNPSRHPLGQHELGARHVAGPAALGRAAARHPADLRRPGPCRRGHLLRLRRLGPHQHLRARHR